MDENNNDEKITTISVRTRVKRLLDNQKLYPRETYDELITRLSGGAKDEPTTQ